VLKNQTGFLNDSIAKLTSKVNSIATHNKMLETQISQVAQQVSQPKSNHLNAFTLRNGRQLEDPVGKPKTSEVVKESNEPQGEEDIGESEKPIVPTPYKPKILFPQWLVKPNLDTQFKKFVDMLKKIYINVPFIEALSQMPFYEKNFKDVLSKKRKIEDNETITLTRECSVVIQKKLPPKLKDPSSFSIPCVIGKETIDKAMCDIGSSVSLLALSLLKRIGIGDLKPTKMTLQFADHSIIYPARILEDIPIKVGKIYIPTDFVVVDIQDDSEIPILLGRPFLATASAIINVKYGNIVFHVGDEKVEFEIAKLMKGPSIFDSCCMIGVIDHRVKECSLALSSHNGLHNPD